MAILIKLQFPSFLVVHGTCVYVCSFGKRKKKKWRAKRAALIRASRSSRHKKRTTKRKQNRTKISRALAESLFFSPRQKKENSDKPLPLVLESERAHPLRGAHVFSSLLRLAVPLINETPYASFITFVVPLWIRPKSFEPAPRLSPWLLPTKRNPLPSRTPHRENDNNPEYHLRRETRAKQRLASRHGPRQRRPSGAKRNAHW